MDKNVIYCGEAATVLGVAVPDNSVDLTVTSPPYDKMRKYKGFYFPFEQIARQLKRVTKPGGVVVWVVADQTIKGSETGTSFRQTLFFMDVLGFRLHDTMFYHTNKPPLAHNRYEQCIEYMFVFSKGRPKTINLIREKSIYHSIDKRRSGKYTHNKGYAKEKEAKAIRDGHNRKPPKPTKIKTHLWYYKSGGGHQGDKLAHKHPAIFPEGLARDHIISWSKPGDVVLDPFCGAGTALKMAKENGRSYIGIDISQEYCDLSQRRVDLARVPLFVPDPAPKIKKQLELI